MIVIMAVAAVVAGLVTWAVDAITSRAKQRAAGFTHYETISGGDYELRVPFGPTVPLYLTDSDALAADMRAIGMPRCTEAELCDLLKDGVTTL